MKPALIALAAMFLPLTGFADEPPKLGEFSLSLTVKDLKASRDFYEKLGFTALKAEEIGPGLHKYGERWLILKNSSVIIGLFQGAFDRNIMTFHPADVRALQKALKQRGLKFANEADEKTKGLGSAMLLDPDGNPILLDQIVP